MKSKFNWTTVDWSLRDADIAKKLKSSQEAVRLSRKKYGKMNANSELKHQSKNFCQLIKLFPKNCPILLKEAKEIAKKHRIFCTDEALRKALHYLNSFKKYDNRIPVLITRAELLELRKRLKMNVVEFAKLFNMRLSSMCFTLYNKNPKQKIPLEIQKRAIQFRDKLYKPNMKITFDPEKEHQDPSLYLEDGEDLYRYAINKNEFRKHTPIEGDSSAERNLNSEELHLLYEKLAYDHLNNMIPNEV